jgi:hypothetical protein
MGITKRCKRCGKQYKLGYNGSIHGCDECLGVQRDINGEMWYPTETEQMRMDIETGEISTIQRSEVFPK